MNEPKEASIKTIGKYSYYMQRCLGEGSFGKVFEGFENSTKEKVAIKKVDFKTIEKDSYLEKAIHDEIRILNKFKHPNIVQLYEVLNSKRSLYIIMDYCKDGDLKKYLRNRKKLSEPEAYKILKQVLKGYQELARQNTIHRDLKPANILINNGLFKICDFGFSKVIKDPNTALKTCVGSPIYMAPQILQKRDYSAKCDIWSLGIIYYELLHGNVPWSARSESQLLQNIKNVPLKFSSSLELSSETEKAIRKMLEVKEQNRANLKDLLKIFEIQSDTVMPTTQIQIAQSKQVSTFQQQKSYTTINTKVINRHYFEELAFRYFVCVELKSRLSFLNRYNFTKNNFERLIVLIMSSVICNFNRRLSEIQRIHQKDVIDNVMIEFEMYNQFVEEYIRQLNSDYATCQILKEFQFTDIGHRNFTDDVKKKAQKMILKILDSLFRQIQQQLKIVSERNEKNLFLYVLDILLDMLVINERQAKTGMGDISGTMKDRINQPIQKRIHGKLNSFRSLSMTQFY